MQGGARNCSLRLRAGAAGVLVEERAHGCWQLSLAAAFGAATVEVASERALHRRALARQACPFAPSAASGAARVADAPAVPRAVREAACAGPVVVVAWPRAHVLAASMSEYVKGENPTLGTRIYVCNALAVTVVSV
jgi:hypothetical protein